MPEILRIEEIEVNYESAFKHYWVWVEIGIFEIRLKFQVEKNDPDDVGFFMPNDVYVKCGDDGDQVDEVDEFIEVVKNRIKTL